MNTLQAYKGRHTRDTRTAAGRQHRGQPAAMLRAPFCVCGRGQCALREGQQAAASERAGCFQKLPPRITQTLQVRTEFLALHRECPVARQSSSSTGAAGNEAGGLKQRAGVWSGRHFGALSSVLRDPWGSGSSTSGSPTQPHCARIANSCLKCCCSVVWHKGKLKRQLRARS